MTRLDDAPHYEDMLAFQCRALELPEPLREYQFCEGRRWRADLAWPPQRLIAECDGGMWARGRHVQALGYEADRRRDNWCVLNGWRVLRFTPDMIESGEAVGVIERALRTEGVKDG